MKPTQQAIDECKAKLATDIDYAIHALHLIIMVNRRAKLNDRWEKTIGNIGFTYGDSRIMGIIDYQITKYGKATPRQFEILLSQIPKYAPQVVKIEALFPTI